MGSRVTCPSFPVPLSPCPPVPCLSAFVSTGLLALPSHQIGRDLLRGPLAQRLELTDPRYVRTALAVQTALGFLLTLGSIRLVPLLGSELGWRHVFLILVIGPVLGLGSMLRLRRLPEARAMAGGRR